MTTMSLLHNDQRRLAKAYYIAKYSLLEAGYADEIDWQYTVSLEHLTEDVFLREAAWVILSSGMREAVVRKKFPLISQAFFHWEDIEAIVEHQEFCCSTALQYFNNPAKINAIVSIALHIRDHSFHCVLEALVDKGIEYLQDFPFIGPVTSYHLAKNIGFPLAKPDRHLCRIANELGYDCVQTLCSDISDLTEEPIPVIDLILWRFATLHQNYLERFAELLASLDHRTDTLIQTK
ncbi:MAG: hypothetical protein KDD67_15990 [Ignavibacteriae bacterium]|nr:hypothetical protein [Ignavibacteriota bacterium]MCB9215676.1 hypothetical protein [Ignavibacteria bacterium]